ncbi:MAG TPA: chemotaxis protein CheW [Gammaproteobacteria bacterium]|nr:chemotaxis protein CheW [Gammaproteobacteria bacterium]
MSDAALAALADRPFELLKALESRARAAAAGLQAAYGGEEWVGLGFRVGGLKLVVAREEIRELMPYPGAHRVPGAKNWLLGLANVRGQLLPIVDMKSFLGGGDTAVSRISRVLTIDHPSVPAGLLVDEVYGFRRFHDNDSADFDAGSLPAAEAYLAGGFGRNEETWGVIGLQRLVESPAFLQAAK